MKKKLTDLLSDERAMPTAVRGIGGALAGGYFGHEVAPKLFGYEGDESATNMSTILDALVYGAIGGMGSKNVAKLVKENPMGFGASVATGEIFPVGMNMIHEGTKAIHDFNPPTASEQLGSILSSPEARGAGAGAAVAGLGALLSGMTRQKSEVERQNYSSRSDMTGNDFLKYLLPAMVAGGVLGNVSRNKSQDNKVIGE